MPKSFRTVGEALKYKCRNGLSQARLARRTGLAVNVISALYLDHAVPTERTLEKLGVIRISKYQLVGKSKAQESLRIMERKSRAKRRHRTPRSMAEAKALTIADPSNALHSLTKDRVLIAVRYRLNPGQHWKLFLSKAKIADLGRVDVAWLAYCKAHGIEPAAPADAANQPKALYSHLKPIDRGQDHRRQLARGERPALPVVVVPMANGEPST